MNNYSNRLISFSIYIKKYMKQITSIMLFILCFVATSLWANISVSPESGHFGKNCIIEFDIIVDTNSEQILWTDMYVESSMEYIDFVPSKAFKYYLPPKIENKNIYLWAFSEPWKELVWRSKFGTLYLKSNDVDLDWYINFVFIWKWETSDTNLSIIWWVDKLNEVGNWVYYFDWDACEHSVMDIEWSFSSIDGDKYIKDMISWFNRKAFFQKFVLLCSKYWLNIVLFILILVSLYFYIRSKKLSSNEKIKKDN